MAATQIPVLCPFCTAGVASIHHADALAVSLGLMPRERNAFVRLWKAHGQWVQRRELLDAIFADDIDGGPDDRQALDSAIFKAMKRIREKLIPTQYRIENHSRSTGLWRIVMTGRGHA